MNVKVLLSLGTLCGLVSGCVNFPVFGSYGNNIFAGTARHNIFSGTSYFQVDSRVTQMHCEGDSYATYAPLFTLSGAGYGGEGELRCKDGNVFKVRWESTSWRRGFGIGLDQNRNKLFFVYGMDEVEAKEFMTRELLGGARRLD